MIVLEGKHQATFDFRHYMQVCIQIFHNNHKFKFDMNLSGIKVLEDDPKDVK